MISKKILHFIINMLLLSVAGQTEGDKMKFEDIAGVNYDYLHPPKEAEDKPVKVEININKLSIRSIDDSDMSFSVALELWQQWQENRLKFPPWAKGMFQPLDSSWIEKIWTPKLYFVNSVDGKLDNIISPSSFVWLGRDGRILYCCRVILKLICEMNLKYFPHDEQECSIQMGSAIFNDQYIVMDWRQNNSSMQLYELQQFEITDMSETKFNTSLGPYNVSCLALNVHLRRRVGYFLINVYIPTILIVIMSMLTFWIPSDAVPARITLGVTSLLTIITKQYQSSMPNVSYIVALNVWLSSCIGFVFFSLLEYAAVIAFTTSVKKGSPEKHHPLDVKQPMVMLKSNGTWSVKNNWTNKRDKQKSVKPMKLDYFSRICFPLAFIGFSVAYWKVYNYN